jgi:hypothetical protein
LLSFKPIEQSVFDAQVAFNLLAGYGQECKPALKDLRAAISRDAASYLGGRAPVPAIQLVQAPVFYGYALPPTRNLVRRRQPSNSKAHFEI